MTESSIKLHTPVYDPAPNVRPLLSVTPDLIGLGWALHCLQLLSQTRQPCSRTCTAQPRRAAAAAHQPSTGAPCISTRTAVLARPISLKSKSVGTSASLSDRHRIRSKISLGFEAPSRQHITFAAGPSEIRRWLLLLDPPEIHTKKRGEGKEEKGGGLPGRRQRRRSSPPRRRPRLASRREGGAVGMDWIWRVWPTDWIRAGMVGKEAEPCLFPNRAAQNERRFRPKTVFKPGCFIPAGSRPVPGRSGPCRTRP